MADIARLGLVIDTEQVKVGVITLHQLTGAAGAASAAAQRLTGASQGEAAGQRAAAAATQVHTAAIATQNSVMRNAMHLRTNMIYQLNDVAVSLASGMNPAMVAMQQGSQILQGGLMPALRTIGDLAVGLVTKFWPVAAAIGVVTAAAAGLAFEFNKTAETQVGVIDVMLAGWGMFADSVVNLVAPVFGAIGGWLQDGWNAAAPVLKTAGNAIIGAFVGAYEAVKATWSLLPGAIGDLVVTAVNGLIGAVESMLTNIIGKMNNFMNDVRMKAYDMGYPLPDGAGTPISPVSFDRVSNPNSGAAGSAADAATGAFGGAQKDYLGDMGAAWQARAEAIARAKQETEEFGGATKAANDNVKALDDSAKEMADTWGGNLKSAWQGFFSDFSNGLKQGKGFWDSLGDAGMNALSKITDKALEMATNGIWDMLFGTLFGGGFPSPTGFQVGGTGFLGGGASSWGSLIPGNANGTNSWRGGLSWVGERGPELLNLPKGSEVIPNAPSMAMAANGNSLSVVRIELSGEVEGRILQQSGQQTVQIVRAASPSIAEQGSKGAGSMLASGDFDNSMSRYGVTAQAKRR